MMGQTWRLGDVTLQPVVEHGWLRSLGTVTVGSTPLRHPGNRWLPWFDTYDGDVFRQFRYLGESQRGNALVVHTRAVSDPDVMFREFRDTSGDLCFRQKSWDAAPLEADLRIVFEPVWVELDGRRFTGFKYHFEFESRDVKIHRLIDRATWEVGGNLDDVTICLRSWLTRPVTRLTKGGAFSTAGFEHEIGCMPGNMWARWSLLPAFDMQYGAAGVLLGWFDRVSLIRTVIETQPSEDWLRVIDSHWFENANRVVTNPKTIVWAPDRLDDISAVNLWTRVHDRERERARAQFGIVEPPPQVVMCQNQWVNFRYAHTYENSLATAAEFGADYLFVDPPWEHMEAFRATLEEWIPAEKRKGSILEKMHYANMCATLDWHVADILGGERELKALCDRAAARGVKIVSWMALHNTPYSVLREDKQKLGHGTFTIFAAKESGRHPDTGYPADCWPLNLNAPVYDYLKNQILGVCRRTGLAGFLWDSFSNLGWWQVDYSKGDMRPQFDRMAQLYAELTGAGLLLLPEGQVTFSSHSMLAMFGGNVYDGPHLPYSYDTCISLWWGENVYANTIDCQMLRGTHPTGLLFECFAHRRCPILNMNLVPREQWHAPSAAALKKFIADYKTVRHRMERRTVLKDRPAVVWENAAGRPLEFDLTTHQIRDL